MQAHSDMQQSASSRSHDKSLPRFIAALLVFTGLALAAYWFQPDRTLRFDARQAGVKIKILTDAQDGGKTEAKLTLQDKSATAICNIVDDRGYCGVTVEFGIAPVGVDMTPFDSIHLGLRAGAADERLRAVLLGFQKGISTMDDIQSLKPHQTSIPTGWKGPYLSVDRTAFVVPNWWVDGGKLTLERAGSDFRHIVRLDVLTAANAKLGQHTLQFDFIEFSGQWITWPQVLLGLLATWATLGFLYLGMVLYRLRKRTKEAEVSLRRSAADQAQVLEDRAALKQASSADSITGLLNKDGLERAYALEALPNVSRGVAVSLLLMEVDNFSAITDIHGKVVGEMVLKRVAELVKNTLRSSDVLSHLDGSQFVYICPRTTMAQARLVAEKLVKVLRGATWPMGIKLTIRVGLAAVDQTNGLDASITNAQAALARAKQKTAESPTAPPTALAQPSAEPAIGTPGELNASALHQEPSSHEQPTLPDASTAR